MTDVIELLFFDTFSHESSEELNLDLVQFPKPVVVSEVRIIPLGAKVQADFPGGVRLGATNPSQFNIEFFVNDLGKPGASTFESLGGFEYSQNGRIHLECLLNKDVRKIPTDGLVLRGWYTTITLAVYGSLTNNISETVVPAPVSVSQSSVAPVAIHPHPEGQQTITPIQNTEWQQDISPLVQLDPYNETQNSGDIYSTPGYGENYESQAYAQNYYDQSITKDPRSAFPQMPEAEPTNWPVSREKNVIPVVQAPEQRDARDIEVARTRRRSSSADHSRDRRRSRGYSRSTSRDRDYKKRDYRSRSPSSEYRSGYGHKRDLRSRDSSYDKNRSYERTRDKSYDRDETRNKRPRTPPMERPHTPEHNIKLSPVDSVVSEEEKPEFNERYQPGKQKIHQIETIEKSLSEVDDKKIERIKVISPRSINETASTPLDSPAGLNEEGLSVDEEQFEPILSDEDIADETDSQFADDYDYMEYSNNDDIIKLFNPYTMELMKHKREADDETNENLVALCDILKENRNISSIDMLNRLAPDLKEAWIEILEQIPSLLIGLTVKNILSIDKEIMDILICWLEIGLDFDLALSHRQPVFKIRHIKCGVRICEGLCTHYDVFRIILDRNINVFKSLFELYSKDYMSLSIKLMILRALDMLLSSTKSIEVFVETEDFTIDEKSIKTTGNGYQILIAMLQKNPLTRIKFAVRSLLKKLHIFEVTKKFRQTVLLWCKSTSNDGNNEVEILESEIELAAECLNDIRNVYADGLALAQPKRFLPVNSQFETSDEMYDRTALHEFFTSHGLLECVSLILNHAFTSNISALVSPVLDLLIELCKNYDGLLYLSESLAVVNLVVRSLLQTQSEDEFVDARTQTVGLELAYKIQALYHIEYLSDIYKHSEESIDQLHSLFCLCLNGSGRVHTADVLTMGSHMKILLNIFALEKQDSKDDPTNKLGKSPAVGYAVDLIELTVKHASDIAYLRRYGRKILELTRQHEFYEPGIAAKLQETAGYLAPLDKGNVFNHDDLTILCELLKNCVDNSASFPGELITCLRVLKHLTISDRDGFYDDGPDHIELKYKHATLQLYSGDGATSIAQILDKICTHYSQPGLHTPSLASNQGTLAAQIILPACQLLRRILSYVILYRDAAFKDLTAISILLRVYNLAHSYTVTSTAWSVAQIILKEVVDTLLTYTQPLSLELTDTEALHKSLWTSMIAETIKFVMSAPNCFIPGLLALSEMLPLPLPLSTKQPLADDEVNTILSARRLWSAHLHCQQSGLTEMIQILCQSSYQPLLQVLRKVCLQLADLAPNTSLLVSKVLMDLLLEESNQVMPCNQHTTRLLYFFACLVSHGSVKVCVLSSMTNVFATYLCTILKTANDSSSHVQAQDFVLSIVQSLFDTEIKLMNFDGDMDQFLANVLPDKDLFVTLISGVIENVTQVNTVTCLPMVIRTLSLLAEYNYGFHYLKQHLLKKPSVVATMLTRISEIGFKTNPDSLTSLSALLEFLRYVTVSEDIGGQLPRRTSVLSTQDLVAIVNWDDKAEHPIRVIEKSLEESCNEDEVYKSVLENLKGLCGTLEKGKDVPAEEVAEKITSVGSEVISLPEPNSLMIQFSKRVVNVNEIMEEKLSSAYWLSAPSCDEEQELDQISLDLSELVRTLLPAEEANIIADVKRILHLSTGGPDSAGGPGSGLGDRGDDATRPMFRTRKMNVEPGNQNAGRKENRQPFVAPMRGRGAYSARGGLNLLHHHAASSPSGAGLHHHHHQHHHMMSTGPGGGPGGGGPGGHHVGGVLDAFRSRPPNTSRPPSLHVDDFQALETRGAQPTGPTGYNRIPRDIMARTAMPYRHGRGRITSWPSSPHHHIASEYHHSENSSNMSPSATIAAGGGGHFGDHFGSPGSTNTAGGGSAFTGSRGMSMSGRSINHGRAQQRVTQRSFLR